MCSVGNVYQCGSFVILVCCRCILPFVYRLVTSNLTTNQKNVRSHQKIGSNESMYMLITLSICCVAVGGVNALKKAVREQHIVLPDCGVLICSERRTREEGKYV